MSGTETCCSCQEPLFLHVEPDSDYEDEDEDVGDAEEVEEEEAVANHETMIPDDVELRCGCHFHWECFLDGYTITQCPNCGGDVSSLSATTGRQQVLCTVRNEGGVQRDFDILPSATEEAYLRTYPEERVGRAFLEFCRVGDLDALVCLVRDAGVAVPEEEEENDVAIGKDVLRYTGTFEGIDGSGLHVAIRNNQLEVAWFLLSLASSLDWSDFPEPVLQAMDALGLEKRDRVAGPDIRSLRDSEERTAEGIAQEMGGPWTEWVKTGRLRV